MTTACISPSPIWSSIAMYVSFEASEMSSRSPLVAAIARLTPSGSVPQITYPLTDAM